jgi:DHA1 family inner membrane transport protein
MVVWGAATFAVVPPLQMRVMRVAHEAPGLSSSVNIGAFNLGNALGAAAGGAVISGGLGYSFVPVMGAIIAALALLLVMMSGVNSQKQPALRNKKNAEGRTLLRVSYAAKFFATNSQLTSAQKCSR